MNCIPAHEKTRKHELNKCFKQMKSVHFLKAWMCFSECFILKGWSGSEAAGGVAVLTCPGEFLPADMGLVYSEVRTQTLCFLSLLSLLDSFCFFSSSSLPVSVSGEMRQVTFTFSPTHLKQKYRNIHITGSTQMC